MSISPLPRLPFGAASDRSALVIAHDTAGSALIEAIEQGGVRVVARLTHDDAGQLAEFVHVDVVYLDVCGASEADAVAMLADVARTVRSRGVAAIAEFGAGQIDQVGSAMIGTGATLLCDPTTAERIAAVAVALLPLSGVAERSREASDDRLKRLNEEVARIAETLARLTRNDPDTPRGLVQDRSRSFAMPPQVVLGGNPKASRVRATIRARRLRDQYFGEGLFADPAWDMLLDLYAAHLEGTQVSVSSLCIAAAVPSTTALRWIQTLHERGLFERHEDPFDKRRAYIGLSKQGLDAMEAYVAAVIEAKLIGD